MANVLIVAYLLIVLAMVTVILLQRSEGGGLGMGSSANSFMSVRGTANMLTRTTAILAALFFAAAIGLTLLNGSNRTSDTILQNAASSTNKPTNILDELNATQKQNTPAPATGATPAPGASTTPTPAPTTTAPANQDAPNVALPAANDSSATSSTTPPTSGTSTTSPGTTTSSGTTSGSSSTTPATTTGTPAGK